MFQLSRVSSKIINDSGAYVVWPAGLTAGPFGSAVNSEVLFRAGVQHHDWRQHHPGHRRPAHDQWRVHQPQMQDPGSILSI